MHFHKKMWVWLLRSASVEVWLMKDGCVCWVSASELWNEVFSGSQMKQEDSDSKTPFIWIEPKCIAADGRKKDGWSHSCSRVCPESWGIILSLVALWWSVIEQKVFDSQTPFTSKMKTKKKHTQENECVFIKAVYKHIIRAQDGRAEVGRSWPKS